MAHLRFLLVVTFAVSVAHTEAGQNTSMCEYFRKTPQSVDVLVGTSVTFECQAGWAAERVRWQVNGSVWDIGDPPSYDLLISPDETWNSSVYSRTLTAERRYNNTRIQCILTLTPGGQKIYSNLALLVVRDFLQVPRSINATLGSKVNFHCIPYYYPYHNVSWYINGTELSQLKSTDISLMSQTTVQITARQKFNNTLVHCRIHDTSITSPTALLLIQGELGAVGDLHVSAYSSDSLLISWTAPFSLDITKSDPDLWFSLSILTPAGGSLPCPDCHHMTTDTFYNFSLTGLSQGMYEINVVSVNAYGVSTESAIMPLYVKVPASTQEEQLCSVHPNTTQLHTGIGLGVGLGVVLAAILMSTVVITYCSVSALKTRFCRSRSDLRRETFQQNPAYEACTPKPRPPPDQQGAYCTTSPQRGRELSRRNTYTAAAAAANVASTNEKVYEEIA